MKNSIYTITSISLKENGEMPDSRCWGFFHKFEDAEHAVLNNYGDLFEYSYNFVVIEETSEGVMTFANRNETWYMWDVAGDKFLKINNKPSCINQVVCFGMG